MNEDLDAARYSRLAPDQAFTFKNENHLVDRGRGHAEVALHLAFGGGTAMDARVGRSPRSGGIVAAC
jgi:hypothetical protein